MILALDTETTGLDLYHGCKPFVVTTCDADGNQLLWEWPVDPFTRQPSIPSEDLEQIRDLIVSAETLVFQNAKFDVTALRSVGLFAESWDPFPWEKVEDTLVAGHMLYTSRPHTLDKMVLQYLDEDITHHERQLKHHVEAARREVRKKSFEEVYGVWSIAKKGTEGMPSARDKMWQADMWLPLALATELECEPNHPWYHCTERYANADSYWTLRLWAEMRPLVERRKLWKIYRRRMKVVPIADGIERRGVTGSVERTAELASQFRGHREMYVEDCQRIAAFYDYELEMPRSGNNQSLLTFVFDVLKLPVVKRTPRTEKGGGDNPAFDKDVIEVYEKELPADHVARGFIESLQKKRKLDTGLQYLESYSRFWIPTGVRNKKGEQCWFRIHPSLNPCGTVQLRWSSNNPNTQNISKQEGFNLRECFGPAPGREWWSLDAQNIELRIPTFESDERELMDIFLRPKDPPYYGSYHLAIFDLLHPALFREHGVKCKDLFESTWYQWVKNGNFAVIYGCQRRKADATYKVSGAFDLIRHRFPKIAQLADRQAELAYKWGYVETIPDKRIDPDRGFPIMASRTNEGGVLPTTPLNYHVSGTAMQWTQEAMIYSEEHLSAWRSRKFDAWIALQVHDELVFDLPLSRVDPEEDLRRERERGSFLEQREYRSNLGRVRVLQREMEKCGEGINVPTPVGVEYNRDNWAAVTLKC